MRKMSLFIAPMLVCKLYLIKESKYTINNNSNDTRTKVWNIHRLTKLTNVLRAVFKKVLNFVIFEESGLTQALLLSGRHHWSVYIQKVRRRLC